MGRAFAKEVLRSVTRAPGRFIAIVVIVAIGCGFFGGLRMTGLGMRKSADRFYDGTRLYDIQLVSTLGVSESMAEAVRQVDGVAAVMPSRSVDVMASLGDEQYAVRVTSLPDAARSSTSDGVTVASSDGDYLNRLVLRDGRWPEEPDECVLLWEPAQHARDADTVQVLYGSSDLDGTLAVRTFRVVGHVTSPFYTSSGSLAPTTLGSGWIQQAVYVPTGAFDADAPFTELFVAVAPAAGEVFGSEAYQAQVDRVADELERQVPTLAAERRAEVGAEAQEELDKNRADYEAQRDEALAKLDEAAQELADAEAKLADGQAELDKSRALLAQKRTELADGMTAWREGTAQVDEKAAQLADGESQLAAASQTLAQKREELEAGEAALEQGAAELEDREAELSAGEKAWQQGSEELDARASELEAGEAAWQQGRDALDAQLAALGTTQDQLPQLEEALAQQLAAGLLTQEQYQAQLAQLQALKDAAAQLDQTRAQLDEGAAQLAAGREELARTRTQLDEGAAQLAAGREELEASRRSLADGRAQLQAGEAALDAQKRALGEGRGQLFSARQTLADTLSRLNDGEAQLADGEAQLADGQRELDQGRADYEDGLQTYRRERADALAKLDEAERELADAQRQIDKIETPDVFVLDRTQNYGAECYRSDSERIDRIATVFPFFFFVVAALVSLTTMTRMVEDDRSLIGTYKALGYSTLSISSKYLAYAGAASTLGAALGIAALSQLLPAVIFEAYGIIYNIPARPFPLPVEAPQAALAALLGIGITIGATLAACLSSLRETPAGLMQPKAPKAGKRILLEHVRPLWARLSFSWKVTLRNIFRYKRRFFMTVIGIAGCTALLLTGFGVRDSINDIIDKQFGELFHYDSVFGLEDGLTTAQVDQVAQGLTDTGDVSGIVRLSAQNMLAADAGGKTYSLQVVVPDDPASFSREVTLRERVSQAPEELGPDSALVSEKLATTVGVGVGDTLDVYEQDEAGNARGQAHRVTVTGVVENYLGSFLYLGKDAYRQLFGAPAGVNTLYADTVTDEAGRKAVTQEARSLGDVRTVTFNDETIATYRKMLRSVDLVMVVLILAAAVLAFVVLYNLANINIAERVREIASLKVLGFTPHEVDAYVFREIFLIVLIGALAGLVVGYFFEGYVIVTAEVDAAMFGREVHWPSYLWSLGLTLVFCVLVMGCMRPKLKAIDMVESLKSVE